MRENKSEKLLVLYEAIGEIDPHVATDALTYRRKGAIKSIRLCIVIAACICILATTLIVGMNIALGGAKSEDPRDDKNGAQDEAGTHAPEATQPGGNALPDTSQPDSPAMFDGIKILENLLDEIKASMASTDTSEVGTYLYNGKMSIIWADEDGNVYVQVVENSNEAETLKSALSDGDSETLSVTPTYKIWVSFGDGRVVTPYLEYSEENTFNGILFDYQPRVLPSEKFVSALIDILENKRGRE